MLKFEMKKINFYFNSLAFLLKKIATFKVMWFHFYSSSENCSFPKWLLNTACAKLKNDKHKPIIFPHK